MTRFEMMGKRSETRLEAKVFLILEAKDFFAFVLWLVKKSLLLFMVRTIF